MPIEKQLSVELELAPLAHASLQRGEQRDTDPSQEEFNEEPLWKVPTPFTPLIGREQDVAAVCALLPRREIRLLTLLGTGGIGKTRLSLEVAKQMRVFFADGVCFVSLAPISDPGLVIPTIASALGLTETGERPFFELLQDVLQNKH
ncbi:MAG TPA: hypothetical protein VIY29_16120, partial [Ktedonobacteraceae bacterium]